MNLANKQVDIFKVTISLSALLVATSIFYYFVVFLPNVEKTETSRLEANKKLQEDCLRDATNKIQTVVKGIDPATTSQQWIDTYIKVYENQKDDCYKRFSDN